MCSEDYGTRSVCVSACVYSWPTGCEPAYERYQRLKRTKSSNVEKYAFKQERETGKAGEDIAWPNLSISGVHMHVCSVVKLEHAYIVSCDIPALSFFRDDVLAHFVSSFQ